MIYIAVLFVVFLTFVFILRKFESRTFDKQTQVFNSKIKKLDNITFTNKRASVVTIGLKYPKFIIKSNCDVGISDDFLFLTNRQNDLLFKYSLPPFGISSSFKKYRLLTKTSDIYEPKFVKYNKLMKELEFEFVIPSIVDTSVNICIKDFTLDDFKKIEHIKNWC